MAGPSTTHAGESSPNARKSGTPAMLLAIALAAPIPLGVVLVTLVLYNVRSLTTRAVAATTGTYWLAYGLYVLIFSGPSMELSRYLSAYPSLYSSVKGDGFSVGAVLQFISIQFFPGLAIGLVAATAVVGWAWSRRPEWEDNEPAPGIAAWWRTRRIVALISTGRFTPTDGRTIGYDKFGRPVVQTSAEEAAHCFVLGGAGSGKTTTMLAGIRDLVERGEPICYVDMKGAVDVPEQLKRLADRYERRFFHFSIADPVVGYHGPADGPAFYDLLGRGDPSRKRDLVISSQKWDVDYFKSISSEYLQNIFKLASYMPNEKVDSFTELVNLLDFPQMVKRAEELFREVDKDPEGARWNDSKEPIPWHTLTQHVLDNGVRELLIALSPHVKPDEHTRSAIGNLRARIQNLRQSTAGHWVRRDPDGLNDINLFNVAHSGDIVVFSLDSAQYPEASALVGGLILQDLNSLASDFRSDPPPSPFHVYIDEFSVLGTDTVVQILARARDARIPTTLATQAMGDLARVDPAMKEQVMGIVSSYILHRTNSEEDAIYLAGLAGREYKYKANYEVELTSGSIFSLKKGAGTGRGNVTQEYEYKIPHSEFQRLEPGTAVYIANSPVNRVEWPTKVVKEDPVAIKRLVEQGKFDPMAKRVAVPRRNDPFTRHHTEFAQQAEVPQPTGSTIPAVAPDATVVHQQVQGLDVEYGSMGVPGDLRRDDDVDSADDASAGDVDAGADFQLSKAALEWLNEGVSEAAPAPSTQDTGVRDAGVPPVGRVGPVAPETPAQRPNRRAATTSPSKKEAPPVGVPAVTPPVPPVPPVPPAPKRPPMRPAPRKPPTRPDLQR